MARLLLRKTPERRNQMLADVTTSRLNCAAQLCLQRCYRAESPISELARYIAELRSLGWSDREIEELEIVVRRILRRVVRLPERAKMSQSPEATVDRIVDGAIH
jgi:hypothetical protein